MPVIQSIFFKGVYMKRIIWFSMVLALTALSMSCETVLSSSQDSSSSSLSAPFPVGTWELVQNITTDSVTNHVTMQSALYRLLVFTPDTLTVTEYTNGFLWKTDTNIFAAYTLDRTNSVMHGHFGVSATNESGGLTNIYHVMQSVHYVQVSDSYMRVKSTPTYYNYTMLSNAVTDTLELIITNALAGQGLESEDYSRTE